MTRSLTARTRALAAGAALLLTVGALAGCSGRPGQAADMTFTGLDGASHSIVVTEKDIDVVAKDMEPKPGQPTDQERKTPTRLDIAGALIEAPIIAEVAQAHGITITDAEIVQLAKEQLGFEPRQASTMTYLRANILFNQLRQQQDQNQTQAIVADLSKLRASLTGDRSPRYPDKAPQWWTQEDPRQQQAPQQGGGQQQAPQQQAPQQGGQQPLPQEGAEQPADSGQAEGQTDGAQGAGDGAAQPGQADGGAGGGGQGADQSEGGGQ